MNEAVVDQFREVLYTGKGSKLIQEFFEWFKITAYARKKGISDDESWAIRNNEKDEVLVVISDVDLDDASCIVRLIQGALEYFSIPAKDPTFENYHGFMNSATTITIQIGEKQCKTKTSK